MGRAKHCTEEEKNVIINLRKKGNSMSKIADRVKCSKKKVFTALHSVKKPETRGRKRKMTAADDRRLIRHCKANPFLSSGELQVQLSLNVSTRTIRYRLADVKLPARTPRKVPLLSLKNKNNRLAFARKHLFRQNWKNVLWSDETKINMFGSDGKQYVRRPTNTAFDPKYTRKTVKHSGGSIMVWGCFSEDGVGPIFWIKNKMCAVDYVNILQTIMLPYAKEEIPIRWEFMQDNDPKHASKLVKQWFKKERVQVMEWPSQSPDLNPIEHLWADLKKRIGPFKASNKDELWAQIQKSWNSIPKSVCSNLVHSMHRRCEEVMRQGGGSTRY
uniref:Transposable element Tcb1 transposase n=1 Tax=Bactrocera latifrons TaxID=174628 RepID=A0A0K8VY49_BACLA